MLKRTWQGDQFQIKNTSGVTKLNNEYRITNYDF